MAIADLQVSTEDLPGSRVGISVEVPPSEVDRALDRVLQRFQQKVRIEGFRPGNAPRELVQARVGEAALREEAIELLVPEVVQQVLQERSIDAIDRPRVDVQEFERGKPARHHPHAGVGQLAVLRVPPVGGERRLLLLGDCVITHGGRSRRRVALPASSTDEAGGHRSHSRPYGVLRR